MATIEKKLTQVPEITAITDDDIEYLVNDPLGTPSSKRITVANKAATTGQRGYVELATTAEAQAGVDTARAVTPAGVAAAIGYTEYVALLTQTGTNAPTAAAIKNDTGATVTFDYSSIGDYRAVFSPAIFGDGMKVVAILQGESVSTVYRAGYISSSQIAIRTANASHAPANNLLNGYPLVVKIYD